MLENFRFESPEYLWLLIVVAVLALVPQEQGGLVSGYNKPSTGQLLPMLTHLWLCPSSYLAQLAWLSPGWRCPVCLFAGPLFMFV